jgi:murein DD-endopeptidase MepM/ murein hydrolase activator NlpD
VQNNSRRNPLELLKNTNLIWDNSDSAQNGTGSWNWPLNDPIRITQGYGRTAYSSRYTGDIHTGVDMVGDSSTVKAVKSGELFQGSMKCGSGNLLYVRVKQADNFDTYYLHVNY